jgi:hypothetical protein
MQPLRIEKLAEALFKDTATTPYSWETLPERYRVGYNARAQEYAAIVLGGEPVIFTEHGVRAVRGGVAGPYKVVQYVAAGDLPVEREKWVYPAAAFVTQWKEA